MIFWTVHASGRIIQTAVPLIAQMRHRLIKSIALRSRWRSGVIGLAFLPLLWISVVSHSHLRQPRTQLLATAYQGTNSPSWRSENRSGVQWVSENWLMSSIPALLLLSLGLLFAARLRYRNSSLVRIEQPKEPVSPADNSTAAELKHRLVVSPSNSVKSPASKESPGKDSAPLKRSGPTDEPAPVVPVVSSKTSGIQEKLETPPLESISHSPEAKDVIVEQPLSNTHIEVERIDLQVKELLAGRGYDASMIDAKDPATRKIIAVKLLSALGGRNYDQHRAARKAFMDHGYFDEALRDLKTGDTAGKRAAAARKLGLMGDSLATAQLISALYDSAPEVRMSVVESLVLIGDPAAIASLNELLLRETSLQVSAVIRDAINSITISETRRQPAVEESLPRSVENPAETSLPHAREPEPEGLSGYANAFQLYESKVAGAASLTPLPSAPSLSPPFATEDYLDAEDEQLRLEEEALRRAAAELEDRRREAETARKRSEEEGRLSADNEARARAEAEARERAEEESRRRAEQQAASRRAEEEGRLRAEEEARSRAEKEAVRHAEEESRFRLEAQTLRRAAEELARKRAQAEAARKVAEEEARLRAEAEARVRAEEEARRKVEQEVRRREAEEQRCAEEERLGLEQEALMKAAAGLARRRVEIEEARKGDQEEIRRRAEAEARIRAEAEARAQAEEEARLRADNEARVRADEEAQVRAAEEAHFRALADARVRAEEEAARIRAQAESRLRAEAEAVLRAEEEARRKAEEEVRQLAEQDRLRGLQEARRHAEMEARVRAEEEARRKAEEELRWRETEQQRWAEEQQLRLQQEALMQAAAELERRRVEIEEARKRDEDEARRRGEAETRIRAEGEARARAEEEARLHADDEARIRAGEEALVRAEEEAHFRAAAEARVRTQEEAAHMRAEDEARLRAEAEAGLRDEEETRHKAEEQVRQLAEQARLSESQEARRRAEMEARVRTEEEARRKAEQEPRWQKAEEQRCAEEELVRLEQEVLKQAAAELARRRVEIEEARTRDQEEARLLVKTDESIRAEAEKVSCQAEEARQRFGAEAQRRFAEERQHQDQAQPSAEEHQLHVTEGARSQAEEERQPLAQVQKTDEDPWQRAEIEQRIREEFEALRKAEEARRQALEVEARHRAEADALQAEDEERLLADEEAYLQAQEGIRLRSEQEASLKAENEAQVRANEDARIRAEEATRLKGLQDARGKAGEEADRLAEEALRNTVETARLQFEAAAFESPAWETREVDIHVNPRDGVERALTNERVAESQVPATQINESPRQPSVKDLDVAQAHKPNAPAGENSSFPPDLLRQLDSQEPTERAAALMQLARCGGDEAFGTISRAFDDYSADVRNAAARALYNLDADRAASFTRVLREGSPERRRKIGAALGASGLAVDALRNLTGESREKTYDAFSLLFLMAKAGEVQPLMRAIEDYPNIEVRLAVVKLLALSGQSEIVPAFRRLAVRGSLPSEVRSAVMEAIYQISSQARENTSSTV